MCKIYHGSAPSYINVNFTSVSVRKSRPPSSEDLLYFVPRHVKPTHFTIMALKIGNLYHHISNVQMEKRF